MYMKILIVIILNLYSQEVKVKGILVFLILTVYAILASMYSPYKQERITEMDFASISISSISIIFGVFINNNPY